jgi:hypothetical protein
MIPVVRRLAGLRGSRRALLLLASTVIAFAGTLMVQRPALASSSYVPPGAAAIARTADGGGYWVATSYGDVLAFGDAQPLGTVTGYLNKPVVGMATTPDGGGYWLVASDGGVFPFGDARGYGSAGAVQLNQPIVGMAATPDGAGYWLVARDGGIFPYGDAGGLGSTGAQKLNAGIVGMAPTPDGDGYWLVAGDGGVFPFGTAAGYGSAGGMHLNQPVVGIVAGWSGGGYTLVAADGGAFAFGDAPAHGSLGGTRLNAPINSIATTPYGEGYWMLARDGGVFPFGDAQGLGSAAGRIRYNTGDVASRPECNVPQNATGGGGKVLVLSLACQSMTAYQDGIPVYTTDITTGRPALPTPPGQYSVLRKVSPFRMVSDWPQSSPYWYPPSWVQYTLWFRDDGYAIHDAPWRSEYGPGTNANGSHGCVNVPMPLMGDLYSWTPLGTPVRVY